MKECTQSSPCWLTIVIPSFNSAENIEQCLKSIVNVHPDEDGVEVLIKDAGSTDGTIALLDDWCRRYPWIWVLSQPDQGVYDAVNQAVTMANGKWLFVLGADDRLLVSLPTLKSHLEECSQSIVYGNVWMEKRNRVYDGRFCFSKLNLINLCHQSVFYPIKLFDEYSFEVGPFTVKADHHLHLRLWRESQWEFRYIPLVIAFYGAGGGSDWIPDPGFRKWKRSEFQRGIWKIRFLYYVKMVFYIVISAVYDVFVNRRHLRRLNAGTRRVLAVE